MSGVFLLVLCAKYWLHKSNGFIEPGCIFPFGKGTHVLHGTHPITHIEINNFESTLGLQVFHPFVSLALWGILKSQ